MASGGGATSVVTELNPKGTLASNLPELKKDLFVYHSEVVVQTGDDASEDPLLLPTLRGKSTV